VLEKLGQGGMDVVYNAHDTHLDRPGAVNVLPPRLWPIASASADSSKKPKPPLQARLVQSSAEGEGRVAQNPVFGSAAFPRANPANRWGPRVGWAG
jgi:hypothetical protein